MHFILNYLFTIQEIRSVTNMEESNEISIRILVLILKITTRNVYKRLVEKKSNNITNHFVIPFTLEFTSI